MKGYYSWTGNDVMEFYVVYIEGDKSTTIANTETAEKADFLAKAANFWKEFGANIDNDKARAIEDLQDIDMKSNEGVLLFAALIHLTTEGHTDKTPWKVIEMLNETANKWGRWQKGRDEAEEANHKKATLIKVTRGMHAGRWRFNLVAGNGEIVATSGSQTYKTKQKAKQTLENCFPDYKIIVEPVEASDHINPLDHEQSK